MKDEQRVYIKGDSERGKEVIKILEGLGGINNLCYTGMNKDAVYFINPQGGINWTSNSNTSTILSFLKEFYKEIKLPRWKPQYKERYYHINWRGAVVDDIWHDTQDERLCYEFGNCFETHDKAKAASYKVQEILNK